MILQPGGELRSCELRLSGSLGGEGLCEGGLGYQETGSELSRSFSCCAHLTLTRPKAVRAGLNHKNRIS